jgi:hypothetical protein
MRIEMIMASTVLASAIASAAAAQPVCAPPDKAAVEAAVRGLYKAAAADDIAGAQARMAPGFYAFDSDRRFTADELLQLIRQAHAGGIVIEWNLGPVDVHLGCDMAWAAWDNHGHVGKAPDIQPVDWQESAVLEWRGGAWRMSFLHSNRVAPPK